MGADDAVEVLRVALCSLAVLREAGDPPAEAPPRRALHRLLQRLTLEPHQVLEVVREAEIGHVGKLGGLLFGELELHRGDAELCLRILLRDVARRAHRILLVRPEAMFAGDVPPPRSVAPTPIHLDSLPATVRVGRLLRQLLGGKRQVVEAEHRLGLVLGYALEHAPLAEELVRDVALALSDLGVLDARLEPVDLFGPLGVALAHLGIHVTLASVERLGGRVDGGSDGLRIGRAVALRLRQPGAGVVEPAELARTHAPRFPPCVAPASCAG